MLPNDIVLVIVYMDAADYSGLGSAVHDLAVQVKRTVGVSSEHSFSDEPDQRLPGFRVDSRIVRVGVLRQIDVRPSHMQEAVRIALGQLCRFCPVHHVVGHRGDPGDQVGDRTNGTKGLKSHEDLRVEVRA
jgi:hypothetical protein